MKKGSFLQKILKLLPMVMLPMMKKLSLVMLITLFIIKPSLEINQDGALASAQSILDVNSFETFSSGFTDMDGLKSWTK